MTRTIDVAVSSACQFAARRFSGLSRGIGAKNHVNE